MKDKDKFRRDCQVNAELLLERYSKGYSNHYNDEGFSAEEFKRGKRLIREILNDYMGVWPNIPVANTHVVGTLIVYVSWKVGDLDFAWGWAEHKGGCTNNTMRENLDPFVSSLNNENASYGYEMDRPGGQRSGKGGGEITIKRNQKRLEDEV